MSVKAGKEREFRRYISESGAGEAVSQLIHAIIRAPELAKRETLLKDFFGFVRSPLWDEIEGLWASNDQYRLENAELELMLESKNAEVARLERVALGRRLWSFLTAGYKPKDRKDEATKKTVLQVLNGVEGKKCLPEISSLIPETVRESEICSFLENSISSASVVSSWLQPARPTPWGNVGSPELSQFWMDFRQFMAK